MRRKRNRNAEECTPLCSWFSTILCPYLPALHCLSLPFFASPYVSFLFFASLYFYFLFLALLQFFLLFGLSQPEFLRHLAVARLRNLVSAQNASLSCSNNNQKTLQIQKRGNPWRNDWLLPLLTHLGHDRVELFGRLEEDDVIALQTQSRFVKTRLISANGLVFPVSNTLKDLLDDHSIRLLTLKNVLT